MPARFYEQDVNAKLKNKRLLSAFLDGLVVKHRKNIKKISLTYVFCSDEYLLQINQQFLSHDTFTDIVTFDLSDAPNQLIGEIYISIDRIKENAGKFATTYHDELHRVIFHGALHLCGFKDKKTADKKAMRTQEDNCLKLYNKEIN